MCSWRYSQSFSKVFQSKYFRCNFRNSSTYYSKVEKISFTSIEPPIKTLLLFKNKSDLYQESQGSYPLVFDLLWSDPAGEREEKGLHEKGSTFGPNQARGGNTAIFGKKALSQFFQNSNISIILRAHQPASEGACIQKNAQVLTVFSSVN